VELLGDGQVSTWCYLGRPITFVPVDMEVVSCRVNIVKYNPDSPVYSDVKKISKLTVLFITLSSPHQFVSGVNQAYI
jgi:hypothetical protein